MSAERVQLVLVMTVLEAAGAAGLTWEELCQRVSGDRELVQRLVKKLAKHGVSSTEERVQLFRDLAVVRARKQRRVYSEIDGGEGGYRCELCGIQRISPASLWGHLMDHRDKGERFALKKLAPLEEHVCQDHSYDEQCHRLAAHFLQDYPKARKFDRACLAQHIQEAVETWLHSEGFQP